jgi:hypothetical protein
MLQWCRVRASRIAAVALLSLAAMGGSYASVHPADCHDGCVALFVEHDHSAHRMHAPAASADASPPLHCLVCHWARSFRPHTEVRFVHAPVEPAGVQVHPQIVAVSPAAPAAQPPLRSPPSVSAHA